MDLISEVIRTVRIGYAGARLTRQAAPGGVRFPAFEGSGSHIVMHGACWLIGQDDPVPLCPGDIVLTSSGAEHGLSQAPCALRDLPLLEMDPRPPSPEPASFEFLCGIYRLEHGQAPQYLRALPDLIVLSPDYDRHPAMRSLIDLLAANVSMAQPGSGATLRALLDLILVQILRQWHGDNTSWWPEVAHPGIAAALREIHENPHRQWTVGRLSEVASMPRTAFSKLFTTVVSQPPMRYLTGWRLSRAAQLLHETDASLARIAPQVGYSTEFAFSAAFRREYRSRTRSSAS
ncbi:AraC-like DNA-binding protein [Kribbella orskensis]|uniref:AraC-like DNA-binding protein n=1 Tax=Kribbella orskensis TaxID=2512216 RepID=A0ABY2B9W6_9ACTN|nr:MULTISPECIES: AraC family transcriptional regulator [Kribbella]TCN32942.1 AraC-like DNA-binding protein [Kribbella sp. VKM Ac-2500]TCO13184.1 AraC-like DNA-binding protein [Kribbella orskensis]